MHGGKDKGICLDYARLSYRRKFLRTLGSGALMVAVLVVTMAERSRDWNGVAWLAAGLFGFLVIFIYFCQAQYNYRKWREGPSPALEGTS